MDRKEEYMAKILTLDEMKKAKENMESIEELQEKLDDVNGMLKNVDTFDMVELSINFNGEQRCIEISKDKYKHVKTLLGSIRRGVEIKIEELCNIDYTFKLEKKEEKISMAGVLSTDKERKKDIVSNVKK